MDAAMKRVLRQQAEAVIEKLERNNMKGYYAASKAEAVEKVAELLHEGDTVAVGAAAQRPIPVPGPLRPRSDPGGNRGDLPPELFCRRLSLLQQRRHHERRAV